jgi:hypothetical protein
MKCEDIRSQLEEYLDGESEAPEVIELHLAACGPCHERYEMSRRDLEEFDRLLHAAFETVKPEKKEKFLRRLAAPRRIRLVPMLQAVAAAVLLAAVAWLAQPNHTLDRYREALARVTSQELQKISALRTGGVFEDLLPMETALLEDALNEARGIAPEVAWDPEPRDAARRVAVRRYLAGLSPSDLAATIPQIRDESVGRYARALMRSTTNDVKLEGRPWISIELRHQKSNLVFEQWRNGAVRVKTQEADGRRDEAVAVDVFELMEKQPELCRRFGIVGEGNRIQVGMPVRSPSALVRRVRQQQDLSELSALRREALTSELLRMTGDVKLAAEKIERALSSVRSDPELERQRRRLSQEEREQVEPLERIHEQVLELQALLEQLPGR